MVCYGKMEDKDKNWVECGITHELVPEFVSEDKQVMQNVTVIYSKFKAFVENYPYNNSYELDNQMNNETV